jgi:hypothetical protein
MAPNPHDALEPLGLVAGLRLDRRRRGKLDPVTSQTAPRSVLCSWTDRCRANSTPRTWSSRGRSERSVAGLLRGGLGRLRELLANV